MNALLFRDGVKNLTLEQVERPVIRPGDPADANAAVVRIAYTGICGTDKHIWTHDASVAPKMKKAAEGLGRDWLIAGHELAGTVVEVGAGVKHVKAGDTVSAESHLICGECLQCKSGQTHVCVNEKIIGVTADGCFAEYAKLPAKVLWPTDLSRIEPRMAAIQEPFGNAVHACEKVKLDGKTVAVFGCGTIGLMVAIIAKGFGARTVIAVEPNPDNLALAKKVGADLCVPIDSAQGRNREYQEALRQVIIDGAGNGGVDVAFEMSGYNDSINNAIASTRRGGDVIFFGLPAGSAPITLEDFAGKVIFKGITMHAVVGRRVFETWEHTRRLLQTPDVAARMRELLMPGAIPYRDFVNAFEVQARKYPKIILDWGGFPGSK